MSVSARPAASLARPLMAQAHCAGVTVVSLHQGVGMLGMAKPGAEQQLQDAAVRIYLPTVCFRIIRNLETMHD